MASKRADENEMAEEEDEDFAEAEDGGDDDGQAEEDEEEDGEEDGEGLGEGGEGGGELRDVRDGCVGCTIFGIFMVGNVMWRVHTMCVNMRTR